MATLMELGSQVGNDVRDPDGSKIGELEEIYVDERTQRPEWLGVSTGLFGRNLTLVPAATAVSEDESLRVPYDKGTVNDAPAVDPDGAISPEEQLEVFAYYGLEPAGEPARRERSGSGDEVTRSEEELHVGTERREAGRARLRKHVVTEHVQTTVPVEREEVRVEREPISEDERERHRGEIAEEDREVVLHEERPVVEKRVEPRERVRLEKDSRTEQERVEDDLRRERVEVEGEGDVERER